MNAVLCSICSKRKEYLLEFTAKDGRKQWVLVCPACDMVELMPNARSAA